MKAAIYNPYLNILGGGEKYILDIAQVLTDKGYSVDIFWSNINIKPDLEKRYGLKLNRINLVPNIFNQRINLLNKAKILSQYDQFYYVSDGSLFVGSSKKNYLIIQSPAHIPPLTFNNRLKMLTWQKIICYSEFIRKFIKNTWNKDIRVIPPAIRIKKAARFKKENIILSVGRYSKSLHTKNQEALISAYKNLVKIYPSVSLIFAGGLVRGEEDFYENLCHLGKGFNIKFYKNISFKALQKLYQRAKIYWHAAGYGQDLVNNPEKAEHFGITTVEAMASGCIPFVFPAGGQKEIITDRENGFYWENLNQLIDTTVRVLKDSDKFKGVILKAKAKAGDYCQENFSKKILDLSN